jgi:uncharacterized protein YcsI (UPF0317 family)
MHQSHARKVTCHFQNLHGAPVRVILRKVLSIELHPPSCTLKDLFHPPFEHSRVLTDDERLN